MTAKGLYVLMVKSLVIEKTDEDKKPKVVIPDSVQTMLTEFGELVFKDFPESLPPFKDIQH